MAIEIISTLQQKNNGTFPIVDTNNLRGGYYQVDTFEERDNIPPERRKTGMLCYVNEGEGKTYKLNKEGKWVEDDTGGSSNIVVQNEDDIKDVVNAKVSSFIYVESGVDGEPALFVVNKIDENGKPIKYTALSDMIKSSIPKLSYTDDMPVGTKLYKTQKDDIVLKFKFSSDTFGQANYKIYRDGVLVRAVTGDKGTVIVNLGKLTANGTFSFTVTATDYLGVPAPETLEFKVICGGLDLVSTFDKTIDSSVFEVGDELVIPYNVSCSDKTATIKLNIKVTNTLTEQTEDDTITVTNETDYYHFTKTKLLGRGIYKIEIQGYTGNSLQDDTIGTFKSDKLTYSLSIITPGEIVISDSFDISSINTNTYVIVPFRIVSKVANYLLMRGTLYQKVNEEWVVKKTTPETGVQCTMNVTAYWSIGALPEGEYKFEMIGSTLDGGITSLENNIKEFNVEQATYTKLQPISANMICYFDANEKRNSDADPSTWYNDKSLGDTFRVKLHDLNYNTNGWKHVDESLSEEQDGEMMLKFTGDSYGELVKVDKGVETKYNPFNIFSNAGMEGITIETTFRTRCVGEMKSKVLTCQEGSSNDTPGVSISYKKMYIASDTQKIDLDFAEDEWVHVVFTIDKNIRSFDDVGQENIENVNPYPTMRIYINGCLCLVTQLNKDKFLDAGGNSFPLMLNCCWEDGKPVNFGECEIKFLRIYNTYFDSTSVLNNYIASIYDPIEQQTIKDKNDLSKVVMPTVTFKRNKNSDNQTTFTQLHAVTEKKYQKSVYVNCTMEYNDGEGNISVIPDIDLLTQGTSSLQYPLKNYKIKAYKAEEQEDGSFKRVKNKFVPKNKVDVWQPQYVYTMKCDYMESSHRNNTPTATFYDKVLKVLGASSPSQDNGGVDAIDGFPCIVYITDDFENDGLTLVGTFMFNLDKSAPDLGLTLETEQPNGEFANKMVSLEGSANSSDSSGCFYKLDESIQSVYLNYVKESYEEYKANTHASLTLDEFKDKIANHQVPYKTYDEFVSDYNDIDYVKADWEPRYSYAEENGLENSDELTYQPMVELINWVSDSQKNGTFKKDFEKHFDLKYTLAYALQMMMFAQVDNTGKNAMFDTWDGVKWYPRPYDMDTELGLANSGTETIGTDAEIIPELSPTHAEGTYGGYSNSDTVTANRYLSYNTKTSKLWNAFFTQFRQELMNAYKTLRSCGLYTVESIMKHQNSLTTDLIGEIYYNKDAGAKYLSQEPEYLKMTHGNRTQKVKQYLKERIIFLDTYFGYKSTDVQWGSENTDITLRSDAFYGVNNVGSDSSTLKCYLGISVYSPQYVTVNVGSGLDNLVTAFVSPDSTYIDPDTGKEEEGTLFSFCIRATDKEMIITGAGNIKNINKLEDLNVRDLTISTAKKILKLNLNSSTRMTALTLGDNKYLRDLDCSYSYLLGTGVGAQSLDLTGCVNLRNIDISYTKLTALTLPQNSNISKINVSKSSIKSINVEGMEFLTDINIEGCEDINNYTVNDCAKIKKIDVSGSSVKSLTVTNCKSLNDVNVSNCKQMSSFDVTGSDNILSLNMNGNTGSVMNDLKLYTLYNLQSLNVGNTTSLINLRLPKYANAIEADKASRGEDAKLWNNLQNLVIGTSSLKYIQYGSANIANDAKSVDMSQLTNLNSISFVNCNQIEKITNINYTADSMNSLFSNCSALKSIQGTLTCKSSAASIMQECRNLVDIDNLVLNFKGVTNLNSALCRCLKGTTAIAKKLLDSTQGSVMTCSAMLQLWGSDGQNGFGYPNDPNGRAIPSNLFENCPNITNTNSMFYGTGYTSVPGDLLNPCANNIQSTSGMFGCQGYITTVGADLLKNKPNLTNVSCMFAHAGQLQYYINPHTNIFEGSPKITNTSQMFINTKLQGNPDRMLEPLTNLTNAEYMFYNCPNITGKLPDGFFYTNTKLRKIDGIFARTGLTQLPDRLFRKNLSDTYTFDNLTEARSVFSDCTKLDGIVSANFFAGATEITQMGEESNTRIYDNGGYFSNMWGFFANTAITGYHETILNPLKKLLDASGLFRKTSTSHANKDKLKYCYYYNAGTEYEYNNSVGENLFKYNTSLQNVSRIFQCNTSIKGHVPPNIFSGCKKTLRYANGCFNYCTTLNGTNLDNTDESVSSQTGISDQWFYGATNLLDVGNFLQNCSNYSGSLPKDLFYGCSNLQYTNNMFYNDQLLQGTLPIELFNYCRGALRNVSGMFYCNVGLQGAFPTGTYSKDTGVAGYELTTSGEEGALKVVSIVSDPYVQIAYSNVVDLSPDLATIITPTGGYYVKSIIGEITTVVQPGFLAECINLQSTRSMFYECKKLGEDSCLPHDIFYTSGLTKKYNNLLDTGYMFFKTGFNKAYIDENTGLAYLCDANMLSKCPNIQNIDGMFRAMRSLPTHQLYPNMFAKQVAIKNASCLFRTNTTLTGAINQMFLQNALGTLEDVHEMFAFCNITSIVAGFLHGESKNTKLKYAGALFYGNSNITGNSPELWKGDVFSAIKMEENGYYGALYNCTKLNNYNDAKNISANWINSRNIWGDVV